LTGVRYLWEIKNSFLRHLLSNRIKTDDAKNDTALPIQNHELGTALENNAKIPDKIDTSVNTKNRWEKYVRFLIFETGSLFKKNMTKSTIGNKIIRTFWIGNLLNKALTININTDVMKRIDGVLSLIELLRLKARKSSGIDKVNNHRSTTIRKVKNK
jgi:hypothetical protein